MFYSFRNENTLVIAAADNYEDFERLSEKLTSYSFIVPTLFQKYRDENLKLFEKRIYVVSFDTDQKLNSFLDEFNVQLLKLYPLVDKHDEMYQNLQDMKEKEEKENNKRLFAVREQEIEHEKNEFIASLKERLENGEELVYEDCFLYAPNEYRERTLAEIHNLKQYQDIDIETLDENQQKNLETLNKIYNKDYINVFGDIKEHIHVTDAGFLFNDDGSLKGGTVNVKKTNAKVDEDVLTKNKEEYQENLKEVTKKPITTKRMTKAMKGNGQFDDVDVNNGKRVDAAKNKPRKPKGKYIKI